MLVDPRAYEFPLGKFCDPCQLLLGCNRIAFSLVLDRFEFQQTQVVTFLPVLEGGTWLFCDTDSIAVVASPKGGTVYPKRPEEECEMDQREIAPIPVLPHSTVLKIARRFRSLNPYSFGGDLLKVEDVNYEDGNPKTGSLRTVHGYDISAKRYALMEG